MTTAQARRRPGGRAAELPSLLSVDESAKLLGISRSAAYRAALADALPTIRWGRRVYVPTGHLARLLGTSEDEMAVRLAKLREQGQDPWEQFVKSRHRGGEAG